MLQIHCYEHLFQVQAFATRAGARAVFDQALQDLEDRYGGPGTECHLYQDVAPNSFQFTHASTGGGFLSNGALLYSGPGQPLTGEAPTFSVSCEPHDPTRHQWVLHT